MLAWVMNLDFAASTSGAVVSVDFAGKLHRPVEVWLVRTVTQIVGAIFG